MNAPVDIYVYAIEADANSNGSHSCGNDKNFCTALRPSLGHTRLFISQSGEFPTRTLPFYFRTGLSQEKSTHTDIF